MNRYSSQKSDLFPEIGFGRTLGNVILEIIALSGREITLSDESKDAFYACFCKDRRIAELWTGDDVRIFISHFSGYLLQVVNASSSGKTARISERADSRTLLDVFERTLPSDTGPAILGTADDLVG